MLVDDKSKPGELGLVITLNQKKKKKMQKQVITQHIKKHALKRTHPKTNKNTQSLQLKEMMNFKQKPLSPLSIEASPAQIYIMKEFHHLGPTMSSKF